MFKKKKTANWKPIPSKKNFEFCILALKKIRLRRWRAWHESSILKKVQCIRVVYLILEAPKGEIGLNGRRWREVE